jgi:hypothetical protein
MESGRNGGSVGELKLHPLQSYNGTIQPAFVRQLPGYSETFREQAARQAM